MARVNKIARHIRRFRPDSQRDWLIAAIGGSAVLLIGGLITALSSPPVPLANHDRSLQVAWLPDTVMHWEDTIVEMAERYSLDPVVLAIIMTLESGGYSEAESPVGAQGLMQVMPPTGQDIAQRYVKEPRNEYDLFDPRTSIEFGAAYLALLRDEFGEPDQGPSWEKTMEMIAAGYNGGPTAANAIYKGEGLTSEETLVYSRDAFNMWRERGAETSPTFERWLERGGSLLIEQAANENR